MATTACTDNYYETVIVGVANDVSGNTNIVTFNTPKPVWTESDGTETLQCNAVTIGGFNGLNS
jgi:hypothetical protein